MWAGRTIRGFIWVVAYMVATAVAPSAAQDSAVVSNVFFQSDLRQALEDVAAQTGVNIVADPSVQGVVTATMDDMPLEDALDLLLAGTKYRVENRSSYIIVYDPDVNPYLFAEVSETRVVNLRHLDPETARDLLIDPLNRFVRTDTQNQRVIVTAPKDLLEQIVVEIETIDRPGVEETTFAALVSISAQNAKDLLPQRLQQYVRVDAQRNTLSVTGPSEINNEIVSLLRRIDRPLPPVSVDTRTVYKTAMVKLDHVNVLTATNLISSEFGQYVRSDERSNTLSVNAPAAIQQQILADIAQIDTPRTHIMLEARVVVLDQADLLNFGSNLQLPTVSAGWNATDAITGIFEVALGYTQGRSFTNALSLTLNMLSQNNDATVISSPQVLAQDGIETEIRVTTEEYFQIVAENENYVRSDLQQIETGTILRITPQVGKDGTLTLDMVLEVSDVVARGEQNLPVVSRRTARSTVQIEDGGTAAVAGLNDARTQVGRTGIPGLLDLPFLGRNDDLNRQSKQVAIFVTANLVGPSDERFRTGRARAPSLGTVDEDAFRGELARVLNEFAAN